MDIIRIPDITPDLTPLVGGKAAGPGALVAAGERVPDGFCLTTAAHRAGTVPEDAVLAAYARLGGGPVAVRSSATAEDLPDASFAGQQDTVLEVEGADALFAAIRACWESPGSERAVAYRAAQGLDHDDPAMAVVVQRMIAPAAAGVMFTANPLTGTRTENVIDAVPGSRHRSRGRHRGLRPLRAARRRPRLPTPAGRDCSSRSAGWSRRTGPRSPTGPRWPASTASPRSPACRTPPPG